MAGNRFALGKRAIANCDVCGFQYPLKRLRPLVVKLVVTNILACRSCWTPDQPQLMLGMYPVDDPQALRNPRPDNTYWQGGMTGLRISKTAPSNSDEAFGGPSGGSRDIQWGWNPVGRNNVLGLIDLPDVLEGKGAIGDVFVATDFARSNEAFGVIGTVVVVTNVPEPDGVSGTASVGDVTTTP